MSETRKFISVFTCADWIQSIISTSYFLDYYPAIDSSSSSSSSSKCFYSCHIFRQKFCYKFLISSTHDKWPSHLTPLIRSFKQYLVKDKNNTSSRHIFTNIFLLLPLYQVEIFSWQLCFRTTSINGFQLRMREQTLHQHKHTHTDTHTNTHTLCNYANCLSPYHHKSRNTFHY